MRFAAIAFGLAGLSGETGHIPLPPVERGGDEPLRRVQVPGAIECRLSDYDVVVGLEAHAQLLTESKMFCGCSTAFGAPPNSQTCPICIGMPGTLPVINRKALMLALRVGRGV